MNLLRVKVNKMPFYDYKCTNCNHLEFDVKRNINENVSLYECPKCKSEMHQSYSEFRFELKGTGWYETDYKNKEITKPIDKDAKKEKSKTDI